MRVLQLVSSFNLGGSENHAVQLINSLYQRKIKVFVAALRKEGELLKQIFNQDKIVEFRINSFYNLNFVRQLFRGAKFIRQNGIQIVHTHDFYSNIFGTLAALSVGAKVIASKRETGGMRSKMQTWVEKQVFRLASVILANSVEVKNYLVNHGIQKEKIVVIHNGVDLKRFDAVGKSKKELLQNFGLPDDEQIKFVMLTANFRHKVKNQAMLLRAAQRLSEAFPKLHFIFAGEGELLDQHKKLADELGVTEKTHFVGRCKNIPELLKISDFCVLTSHYEGFPNAILEYMAARKPVVATDVGGVREAVIDGVTGLIVKPDDDEALANCLKFLLQNNEQAQRLAIAGRKLVEEKFSLETQIEKFLELYRKILQ
ncbi:MAG: glycosyltransferase [Pyrinomonadaceae bacterium]|nr:glycosyltransferase [Pyrinomonadaceae bacterium]MCX7640785.1 glycosyltransferase [Pyrinomonadaceae bacterium]MDW8304626.1 glycosyltransferase [Acidobacteriota bacterium]